MKKHTLNVLIVDDEPNILKTLGICFEDLGYETFKYDDPRRALKSLEQESYDLAFVDLKMSPINGIEVLEEINRVSPSTTIVIITAHGSVASAVEAIKKGAYDYLQKPFEYDELQIYARRIEAYHRLTQEVKSLRAQVGQESGSEKIITRDKKVKELIDLSLRVADTDLPVLIEGESGTGKELFAQLIKENSTRRKTSFIKINCAAVPENLLESELFGHVKGAFTGAVKDRPGRFEVAHQGTVFLDEIAELSPALQSKLLRILQSGEYERVGESKTRRVDVRILAATNRNIEQALHDGTFREDLFFRLNSVRLLLPPLRERVKDLEPLIRHFLKKYASTEIPEIMPEAMQRLRQHPWRGNIRELENTVERIVLLCRNNRIRLQDLPEELSKPAVATTQLATLEEMEKEHIKFVLQNATDMRQAAKTLGIDPATLWRKRKRYNL